MIDGLMGAQFVGQFELVGQLTFWCLIWVPRCLYFDWLKGCSEIFRKLIHLGENRPPLWLHDPGLCEGITCCHHEEFRVSLY